jgi:hypothetical protein
MTEKTTRYEAAVTMLQEVAKNYKRADSFAAVVLPLCALIGMSDDEICGLAGLSMERVREFTITERLS